MYGVFIDAKSEGYSPDQVRHTLTVAELIEILETYDEDMKVYLRHDNGYTFGGITYGSIKEIETEED